MFFFGQFTFVDLGYGVATQTAMSYLALLVSVGFGFLLVAALIATVLKEQRIKKERKLQLSGLAACASWSLDLFP